MKQSITRYLLLSALLAGVAVDGAFAMGVKAKSVASVGKKALSVNMQASSSSSPSTYAPPPAKAMSVPQTTQSGTLKKMSVTSNVPNTMSGDPLSQNAPGGGSSIYTGPNGNQTSTGQYGLVTARPDFKYNPQSLRFQAQNTSTTGQLNFGIGPGRPAGSPRFVPVGEF